MRTRSQRRAAARDRRAHDSRNPGSFRPALAAMVENPNRGKRHAARLDVLGERGERDIRAASRDYRPLTVHTPILRARKSPRTTSYTI